MKSVKLIMRNVLYENFNIFLKMSIIEVDITVLIFLFHTEPILSSKIQNIK